MPFVGVLPAGKITVEHLLTHTGGFPFTTISKPLSAYADLAEVAAEAAATERAFEPGTSFEYSDAGSDTLRAIVAAITSDVGGMQVPFRIQQMYASELIGRVETTVKRVSTDVDVPAKRFAVPKTAGQ